MGRSIRRIVVLLVAAAMLDAVLAGCSAPAPTVVPAALYVENRVAAAVLVGISERGRADSGVRLEVPACGGRVVARPGADGVPVTDWLIGIQTDPVADPEAALSANPSGVPAESSIIWSTGMINPADLPQWITIEPGGVVVTDHANASPMPSPCSYWLFPTETTPP